MLKETDNIQYKVNFEMVTCGEARNVNCCFRDKRSYKIGINSRLKIWFSNAIARAKSVVALTRWEVGPFTTIKTNWSVVCLRILLINMRFFILLQTLPAINETAYNRYNKRYRSNSLTKSMSLLILWVSKRIPAL